MNASNYTNDSLIKYSAILSSLILFNYFLWSLSAWQIIREVNFIFLLLTTIFFFVSRKYNDYWDVKIIILILLMVCLGSPTIDADSRSLYLFSSKMLYYESNLYFRLDSNNNMVNYFNDIVYSKPKLSITLTATLAQLLGYWNEIYPKSTNTIIILPPIIFLISFFKDRIFILVWLFLMLFFSGRLLINGLMDGIIALYFVSCTLISYKILTTKKESEKLLFYLTLFIFFTILSLTKNEGGVMVLVIFLSSFLIDFIYERKVNIKLFFTTLIALCPIGLWKYMFIKDNIKMEFLHNGDPISKFLSRITNSEDLINIISFLASNEKLLISILIFTFVSYKFFNDNKKLIFFISLNFLLYFSALIVAVLLTPHTVHIQLIHSSSRIFIPLVLMLSYFSVFLIYKNLKKNKIN